MFAIGHSFGAHIVCNYLGGYPGIGECLLEGGVALSPPCDMIKTALHINSCWVGRLLVNALKRNIIRPNLHIFKTKKAKELGLS